MMVGCGLAAQRGFPHIAYEDTQTIGDPREAGISDYERLDGGGQYRAGRRAPPSCTGNRQGLSDVGGKHDRSSKLPGCSL
jgi:hypothetical protein